MYGGDRIPEILPTKHFPLGDITDAYKNKRVDEWIDMISNMDNKALDAHMKRHQRPVNMVENSVQERNHNAAVDLCKAWDGTHPNSRRYAITGHIVAVAFNEYTHYLPTPDSDLSDELKRMSHEDQQLHRAKAFGSTAWKSIQQYPNVHATHEKVFELACSRWRIAPDDQAYFMAGFMLPFIMSVTGRLINYTPEFSGLKTERHDLRTTNFSRFFTNDVELAPDIVLPKTLEEES